MAIKWDKIETYVALFGEGLAILLAIFTLQWIAGMMGFIVTPSIEGMLAAFNPFDVMLLVGQIFGTIVLAVVLNIAVKPLVKNILG